MRGVGSTHGLNHNGCEDPQAFIEWDDKKFGKCDVGISQLKRLKKKEVMKTKKFAKDFPIGQRVKYVAEHVGDIRGTVIFNDLKKTCWDWSIKDASQYVTVLYDDGHVENQNIDRLVKLKKKENKITPTALEEHEVHEHLSDDLFSKAYAKDNGEMVINSRLYYWMDGSIRKEPDPNFDLTKFD